VSLPQFANRGVLGSTAKEGDAGSFFQGVFATVLATPCTAPFLGTALGFAFTQSGWTILLMFFAIAAGMASPYFLLAAQPAWLRLLPKPGPWMLRVKQLMGFLLLATLLFLLAVLGAERGAFQRLGVTKIKADWTNADPAITKILKQFGRPGVPMYVLYPGNHAEPILFPELLTQNLILEKLETVSPHVATE